MAEKKKIKWSRDLPTETGVYHVRNRDGVLFWAYYTKGYAGVKIFGEIVQVGVKFITDWYGPYAGPGAPRESV